MKKNIVLSLIAIFLCFMVGYAAYEVALLTQTWIMDQFSDCKKAKNPRCTETPDAPGAAPNSR